METQLSRAEKLDRLFGTPAFAVIIAILCNAMWGSAFPFIKLGYRLFAIDTADTASILCFAGVRFMLGSVLVLGGSLLLEGRLPAMPKGKILAECCALGLWQTTAQYAFFYSAVALLTGAFGGILNSTQSFLGVISAHFLYGRADRMTPAKALGCGIGFAGVLIATLGNHGGGSARGVAYMLIATVLFTLAGPWNKSVTRRADSFAVCFVNLFVGGAALFLLGAVLGGRLEHWSVLSVLDLLALAFICGAGYIVWALLMKNNPVSRIAIFGFVNPVVNVLLSALINGEPLFRWQYLGALVLVCIGIWLVNKAPAKKERALNMEYPIFDTHAHYSARAFDADRFALLDSLPGKGVVGVCEQATHSGDAPKVLELAHKYPWVYAAVGIHPESLLAPENCGEEGPAPTVSVYGGDWAAEMRALAPYYKDPKVVAVGECGLDYHWPVPKDAQLALFEAEIRLALELDKPIIVHDRSAHADVYALLKKYRPKGIVHCYSGSADDALWLAEQGLYIGFGGACTFKGAKRAAKAIAALPLERIVLETDCPYMAPEPVRGTRCDSSLIRYVGEYIASIKGEEPEQVFRQTVENACQVYNLSV